jgi:thiol-disulfide isomerase/thioredoxin
MKQMNTLKHLLFINLIALLFLACGNESNNNATSADVSPTLTGKLTSLPFGTSIYLDYLTPTNLIPKDTATVDKDGNFAFTYPIKEMGYYRVRINNQNFVNLILKEGETPVLTADGSNLMGTYNIEGSEDSEKLRKFNLAYQINAQKQDSLGRLYQQNPSDQQQFIELQIASQNALAKMNNYFKSIIDEDPGSLVSLAAVQMMDAETNFELYKKVDDAIQAKLPNSIYTQEFHAKVKKMSVLAPGSEAPDITLNDVNGNPISLSSLRGKVVLVDFWASWCKPCRIENPNVVEAYKKFNKKGFEVFSVSLDGMQQQPNPKQDWINAIEKDNLIWKNHVSDLKGWNSTVVPLYNISGIPFAVLLDRDGKIIAKNLRGEELHNKLAELF